MSSVRRWCGVLTALTICAATPSLAGTASFGFRKLVTIDATQVMGAVDHASFPVLVSLSDLDLRTAGSGGRVQHPSGYDIAFTAADGATRLDFEIESYDGAAGTLVAWVKIPTLQVAANTLFYLYYGSADIFSPQETVSSTWSEGYLGVWHLEELGQGELAEYQDSSPFRNHGIGGNGSAAHLPAQVPGQVGSGQYFDRVYARGDASISAGTSTVTFANCSGCLPANVQGGDTLVLDPGGANEENFTVLSRLSATQVSVTIAATLNHAAETYVLYEEDPNNDMINVGDDPSLDVTGDQITLQAWIRHDITPDFNEVFGILNHKGFNAGYRLTLRQNTRRVTFELPGSTHALNTATSLANNVWHQVVATYDGATMRVYLNGVVDANTLAKTGGILSQAPRENDVWLGHGDQPVDKSWSYPWEGSLDEIRISSVARSADWVATEYNNQSSPSTFHSTGPEEPGAFSVTTFDVNVRSIGTGGQLYATGQASVGLGSRTVTFAGATIPATVGAGDRLILDPSGPNQETLFIRERDTLTQVTVQTRATLAHVSESFSIERAYGTLQSWESDRDGDLVTENRREIGVAYKDGDFTGRLAIDDSTTDAFRFMSLTVAPGHRHTGVAGTGVVLRPAVTGIPVQIRDPYTRVEWLEITGWTGAGADGITVVADQVLLRHLLIHDGGDATSDGIQLVENVGNFTAKVENTIVYDVPRACYNVDNVGGAQSLFLHLENVTAYGCGAGGDPRSGGVTVCEDTTNESRVYARNVLSVGNFGPDFHAVVGGGCGGTPSWTISDANVSSDGTAPGPNSFTLVNAANQFVDLTPGAENLHLKAGADAIDKGQVSLRYFDDIDSQLRLEAALWDVGADELEATTAVELSRLEASAIDDAIVVEWETATELDNLGFHLYRATSANGPYSRLTDDLVPGLGSSAEGGRYRYLDRGLPPGRTYFYELEDVETTGARRRHGPISATTSAGGKGSAPESPESVTWAFGEPEDARLTVSRPSGDTAILVLDTPGFSVGVDSEGSLRLAAEGFDESAPPVRRVALEALPGRGVELLSVQASELVRFPKLELDGSANEIVASRSGAVRLRRRSERLGRGGDDRWARVESVGYQGEVKKALLELSPFQWDTETGELLLARRLTVRLSFRRADGADVVLGRRRGRRRPQASEERRVLARIVTRDAGLYAVPYEDLFGPSSRSRAERPSVRLSRQGEAVAFRVEPGGGELRPGTTLFFWSDGEKLTPYGREAVYELETSSDRKLMESSTRRPGSRAVPFLVDSLAREENRYYQAGLLSAPDLWLWDLVPSGASKSFPFTMPRFAGSKEASLSVRLQGTSDLPEDPDHHVQILVNGEPIGETFWNGKVAKTDALDLVPGILREGENQLTLVNAGDTGAAYSLVMLDGFDVSYPRALVADAGRLTGRAPADGVASASGFASGAFVLDATEGTWLGAVEPQGDAIRFAVSRGHLYRVVAPEALLRPQIRRGSSVDWVRSPVDYLAIAPRKYASALHPLLRLREERGLTTRSIAIEDVYDELGFGEPSPDAIHRLVSLAFHEWNTRYVLLAGDGTYDFKDHLGTGKANSVPPRMIETSYLWTASDPSYAAVNGEDVLPDVAIGRLPAASRSELEAMVEKIIEYERGTSGLLDSVVLVADDPDRAGRFASDAEALARGVLSGTSLSRIYLEELGVELAREKIRQSFDAGSSLMSYLGHGGIHLWADENLLDLEGAAVLAPSERMPLLLTMNCLNGYFHFPYFDSLSERLLKLEDRGVVAAFSPSGLSVNAAAKGFHELLLEELVRGDHERLGDAVMKAQERYVDSGAMPELVRIYHLLGDPALSLRR